MLQEVAELQHQQRGMIQHMQAVNRDLETAEKRHKYMVSFLGKVLQKPGFLARLREKREQKGIASSSQVTRKFVKHHEPGISEPSHKGDIVTYQHDPGNSAHYPVSGSGHAWVEDIAEGEMELVQEFLTAQMTQPQKLSSPERLDSFPEQVEEEKRSVLDSRTEHVATGECNWSTSGFNTDLWSNSHDYSLTELGHLSDAWDIPSDVGEGQDDSFGQFMRGQGTGEYSKRNT